jgi:hypothetical protein
MSTAYPMPNTMVTYPDGTTGAVEAITPRGDLVLLLADGTHVTLGVEGASWEDKPAGK